MDRARRGPTRPSGGGKLRRVWGTGYRHGKHTSRESALGVHQFGAIPARLAEELRTALARRDELQARGETIVAEFGLSNRFAKAPLARIEQQLTEAEGSIVGLEGRIAVLRAAGGCDEREMAVATLLDLWKKGAPAKEVAAVRLRLRQIVRDTFAYMYCDDDGHVDIGTIDGGRHRFRDGYWWHEPSTAWLPWSGAMMGMGSRATKEELRRRAAWLAEAEAVRLPLRWDPDRREWIADPA